MGLNAAKLDVKGDKNPNWKGGLISKKCEICGKLYFVKRSQLTSRFCSLKCVGQDQKGKSRPSKARVL